MATQGLKLMEGPVVVREFPSAATGTYYAGDVVGLTSGACVIGANSLCAGVALKAAVTSGTTPIIVIDPTQIWNIEYAGTTAVTMEGEDYLMTYTAGSQCLSTTTTTPTMTIVQIDPRDGAKATGRVHARFNVANCQLTGLVTAAA